MKINRKLENSTTAPAVHKSPEPMATKFVVGDDVGGTNPCAKFHYDPIRGFCSPPRFAPARTGAYSDSASCVAVLSRPYREAHCTIFTIYTSNDVVSRHFGDVLQSNIIFCDICCFRSASSL